MEGKAHSSQSYNTTGRMSRMKEDLLSCSKDFRSSFQQRTATRARGAFLSSEGVMERPHVGVVGAGLAGLRCAEILISEGVKVTILEARDRLGGRVSYHLDRRRERLRVVADSPEQSTWSCCRHVSEKLKDPPARSWSFLLTSYKGAQIGFTERTTTPL